mmetsp:Transcript_121621/g.351065  ORF Transcript_121621/g.351065 Transcript_121621/m.351065 type:complete len:94 (+) Transcript_121621:132-413(+)
MRESCNDADMIMTSTIFFQYLLRSKFWNRFWGSTAIYFCQDSLHNFCCGSPTLVFFGIHVRLSCPAWEQLDGRIALDLIHGSKLLLGCGIDPS